MPIQVYSFFSGVGFLDLGFENAGFDIAFVDEYDERFLRAYQYARRNNDHVPRYGYSHDDIREYLSDQKWQEAFPEYWMVFIGSGAKLENGGESVIPYEGFNIANFRNHRQYYYGMVRSERNKGDMDICFFDRDTNREVARY